MVSEINHRVTNVFATLLALIERERSQTCIDCPGMEKLAYQVNAYALLQRRTSFDSRSDVVDMDAFLQDLMAELQESVFLESRPVVTVSLAAFKMTSSGARSIALVLIELAMNSAKHAFHSGREPQFSLRTSLAENKMLQIEIADNGPGYEVPQQTNRSGLKLIGAIVRGMGGTFAINSNASGTANMIQLPV